MNQNKPFYVALVAVTCAAMLLCGFVFHFAWSMRSDVNMAKSNVASERQYSLEKIKQSRQEMNLEYQKIKSAINTLTEKKTEISEIQAELKHTIEEYKLAKKSLPDSVQKDENNSTAFLVIWQSTLEEEDNPVYVMSKKDVAAGDESGVHFYHTLSRVFTPAGLIEFANQKHNNIISVADALQHIRQDGKMLVIPLH